MCKYLSYVLDRHRVNSASEFFWRVLSLRSRRKAARTLPIWKCLNTRTGSESKAWEEIVSFLTALTTTTARPSITRQRPSTVQPDARVPRAPAAATTRTAPKTLTARPTEGLQRPTCAEELANQRFRIRDVDSDVTRTTEGGKQIDVFTEHVVELHVSRRHVRVSDAARTVEVDALRLRVRDVDRRRARVTDQESVMNVLTEKVRVSDVVTRRLTAALGGRRWHAVGREVHTDGEEHERVEFGDVKEEETVVTMPDEGFGGSEDEVDDVDGLTIEEVYSCSNPEADQSGIAWMLCASEDCSEAQDRRRRWRKLSPRAPESKDQLQENTSSVSPDREEELKRRLAQEHDCWCSGVCKCSQPQQRTSGRRKLSKRSRQTNSSVGILNIKPKHNRRHLQYRQARARGAGGRR